MSGLQNNLINNIEMEGNCSTGSLNWEYLKKYNEDLHEEVERMKQHPYTYEEAKAQVERIHQASQSAKDMRESQ